jgi:hypothetical protein
MTNIVIILLIYIILVMKMKRMEKFGSDFINFKVSILHKVKNDIYTTKAMNKIIYIYYCRLTFRLIIYITILS